MKSYTINIDRTGNLDLSVSGIDVSDYAKIIKKFNDLGIKFKYAGIKPGVTHFTSTYEYEDQIVDALKEMRIQKNDGSLPMDIPVSSSSKEKAKIKVKSFSLGDLEIELDKIDGLFTVITRKIFQDQVSFNGKTSYIIYNVNKRNLKWYIDALKASSYSTSSLDPILGMVPDVMGADSSPIIMAQSASEENPLWNIKMSVKSPSGSHSSYYNKLRQIINFLFAKKSEDLFSKNKEEHHAEISVGGNNVFYIRGSYAELKNLQIVLEKNGYNTQRMSTAIDSQVKNKFLSIERMDGELDVGEDKIDAMIKEHERNFFYDSPGKSLFPEQIKGIKFLYSRRSALLGDEVGVGKTIQTIIAANIRMKVSGGYCLIITKDQVVDQISKEISKITGDPASSISNDWSNISKWTVLNYSLFGNVDQRKVATEFLVNNSRKFTVCILDEIHIIKNGEPSEKHKDGYLEHGQNHQTFNVQEITQNIPFVWGASSTIIANRPVDLLNQLKAINHPMGRMDYEDFLRYFDDRTDEHEQMRKADLIRDLLNDQGVYLRRSKKEVNPSIPNVNTNEESISLTQKERENIMAGITGKPTFKDITKIRAKIAASKVEMTVQKAANIIEAGKKVAIFTAYPGSTLKPIQEQLELILLSLYPSGNKKVASIVGGESKEKRSQTIEEIKDPASDIVAIIISIDAGGTGLDFPNILTDVIVNDFDWTPSDDEQSLGRFHRISSKEPINVTYMVASNTLDQKYYKLLQEKKEIAERIQNLSNQEKEAISAGKSSVSEDILRLRKQRYEEQMKLSNIHKALTS